MRKHLVSISCALVTLTVGALLGSGAFQEPSTAPKVPATWAPGGKLERLTADNCVLALVDHQTGLMNLVDSSKNVEFKSIVIGLAKIAKLHNLPTVITTSAETGPNGPFMPEVLELLPNAPLISRPGQIDAWDNADFVAAIEKTGRKKIVLAGITTDVCVAFATLSAIDAGYEVYVVTDACGAMNPAVQEASLMRMSQAGATMGTWFAFACELLSDWRRPTGAGTAQLFVEHMPSYAEIFHSHRAHSAPAPTGR